MQIWLFFASSFTKTEPDRVFHILSGSKVECSKNAQVKSCREKPISTAVYFLPISLILSLFLIHYCLLCARNNILLQDYRCLFVLLHFRQLFFPQYFP